MSHIGIPSPVDSVNSLAEFLGGFSDAYLSNVSDHTSAAAASHAAGPKILLGLIISLIFGVAAKFLPKNRILPKNWSKRVPRIRFPYTVVLIFFGLGVGAVSNISPTVRDFTGLADTDPHYLLYIFLPLLIFESAYTMDVHVFWKTLWQSLTLAVPGMLVCILLTAVVGKYAFPYEWSWVESVLFGTILSATDPVAVVALLKDLGVSKRLSTVIEGESLLNDGVAIVVFNVLLAELQPNSDQSGLDIFRSLVQVPVVSLFYGWISGKLSVYLLSKVYNHILLEFTITVVGAYFTYYMAEAYLEASGVLSVVVFAIVISSNMSHISPEVEENMHSFWETLAFYANTIIFILVGVVIVQQAFVGIDGWDWLYLLLLYLCLNIIRLTVVLVLTPLLSKIGYDLTWKHSVVISWGGLRGAVGLALALVVALEGKSRGGSLEAIGRHTLFYTAGIVVLTLVINGSTTEPLLRFLGMSDISPAKKLVVEQAVQRLQYAQLGPGGIVDKHRSQWECEADLLRTSRNCDWGFVESKIIVEDPYAAQGKKPEQGNRAAEVINRHQQQNTDKPRMARAKKAAVAEELREKSIELEKSSYRRQRNQGKLGRHASDILRSIADDALDTPKRLILKKDIESYWRIPKLLVMMHSLMKKYQWKTSTIPPAPVSKFLKFFYRLSTSAVMEGVIMGVIVVNLVLTIVELVVTDDPKLALGLQISNYFFVALYILEAVMKMLGLRKHYWCSFWNIFDLGITIISVMDAVVIDAAVPASIKGINLNIIRIVRLLRILRVLRVGLFLKKMIVRLLRLSVDRIINNELKFAYDIAKGLMVAKLAMLSKLDKLDFAGKEIIQEHRNRSEDALKDIVESLREFCKIYPEVEYSVRLQQVMYSIVHESESVLEHIEESLALEESSCKSLHSVLKVKKFKLSRTPPTTSLPQNVCIEEFGGEVASNYSVSTNSMPSSGAATSTDTVIVMDEESDLSSYSVSTRSYESSVDLSSYGIVSSVNVVPGSSSTSFPGNHSLSSCTGSLSLI